MSVYVELTDTLLAALALARADHAMLGNCMASDIDGADLMLRTAERDALLQMLREVLMSARPNRRDHPTMRAAWERAEALIESIKEWRR